jgi:flagellar basal-body rod modification protein FlgD
MTTSSTTNSTPLTPQTSTPAASATTPGQDLANEQTFLQLFVAQLKNQDPLNPNAQDPTQMVTELAQFSQLEQSITLNSTVTNIDSLLSANKTSTSTSTPNSQGA